MKILILLLTMMIASSGMAKAPAAPAKEPVKTVLCELQSFSKCTDCQKRIPASCENHAFNGSLDLKTRPVKLHWLESNPKAGTEKLVIENNSKKTLGDLKSSKNKRQLVAVEIPASTALYKDQSSTVVAATMTASNKQTRAIASEKSSAAMIGGIGRAQQACGKKGCL